MSGLPRLEVTCREKKITLLSFYFQSKYTRRPFDAVTFAGEAFCVISSSEQEAPLMSGPVGIHLNSRYVRKMMMGSKASNQSLAQRSPITNCIHHFQNYLLQLTTVNQIKGIHEPRDIRSKRNTLHFCVDI